MNLLAKTFKLFFLFGLGLLFSFVFLSIESEQTSALGWNGGTYTNLCGTGPYGAYYACPGSCNTSFGSCSGAWVVKFTCNGQQTECTSNESAGSNYQAFDTWINGQTQQIDVFNHNCRAGGGWSCGPTDLLGYMVWYKPPACVSSCGTSAATASQNSPAANAILTSTSVNFSWGLASAGQCGGNNCGGGSCNSTSTYTYSLNVVGVNGTVYNYNLGQGSGTSRTLTLPTRGTYDWRITITGNCGGSRTTGWRRFVIDQRPTVTASYLSSATCLGQAGSNNFSGEHPVRAAAQGRAGGINNPMRIRATYADLDGIGDLRDLYVWLGNNNFGISGPNIANAAVGRLRVNSIGNYQLWPYQPANDTFFYNFTVGSGWAICSNGSGNQTICNINNLDAYPNAIAFAYPVSITPSGNSYIVDWDLGMLSSAKFGAMTGNLTGAITGYATVYDRQNVANATGWQSLGGTKRADLTPPANSLTTSYLSPNSFSINYATTDTNPIAGTIGKTKRCTATSLSSDVTLSQTTAPAGSRLFSVGNPTFDPCFSVNTGTFNYAIASVPSSMNFAFTYDATDLACNVGTQTSNVGVLRPWLMTTDGDMFVKTNLSQTSLASISKITNPAIDTSASPGATATTEPKLYRIDNNPALAPYLSSFNYYDNFSFTSPAKPSRISTALLTYPDKNGAPSADSGFSNWYDFLLDRADKLVTDTTHIKTLTVPDAYFGAVAPATLLTSNIPAAATTPVNGYGLATSNLKDRVVIIKAQQNLRVQRLVCNNKIIFFVPGDLIIEPDLDIQDGAAVPATQSWDRSNQNGCLFIVKGKTTITAGTNKPNPAGQTAFDIVKAFIITDSFETSADASNNGLLIVGGVITNQNNSFLRDAGAILNNITPSELFRYDGTRYLFLFGSVLGQQVDFSIKEAPFIDSK